VIAYVTDLPGRIATGATVAEASLREAIAFHLDGMREDGQAIPHPASSAECVAVVTASAIKSSTA